MKAHCKATRVPRIKHGQMYMKLPSKNTKTPAEIKKSRAPMIAAPQ
jgi:hypothetical protein